MLDNVFSPCYGSHKIIGQHLPREAGVATNKTKHENAMKRLEARTDAQRQLLLAMQTAFNEEAYRHTDKEVWREMSKQMGRIETLFGYEKYSWMRGA